ncbi:MAG: D-glycero-D-manno-heptose 1-phosphate guanosyltransferase [Bacteroidetes bacterium]|nr:MAG: D-glycero-D-manno-heptose 1-phosphate guanosyltransferase [Bacteroidota bacterium]
MAKVTEAILLAGGFGTRLQSVVKDIPKPMANINGKPFLQYLIEFYAKQGINHIVLSVGHLHHVIQNYFGNHYAGVSISYAVEDHPLGTGGAIRKSLELTKTNDVFVANGDTLFAVDLALIAQFHDNNNADITLVTRRVDEVSRYGSISMDNNYRIVGFKEKNSTSGKGYINGGVYLIGKKFFNSFSFPEKFSIEKDFFEKHFNDGVFLGKPCSNYFIDIGIPEDYARAKQEFLQMF